jgi:hypothetical protein
MGLWDFAHSRGFGLEAVLESRFDRQAESRRRLDNTLENDAHTAQGLELHGTESLNVGGVENHTSRQADHDRRGVWTPVGLQTEV